MLVRTLLTQCGTILALSIAVLFTGNAEILLQNPVNLIVVLLAFVITFALGIWDIMQAAADQPKRFAGKKRDAKIRKFMTELFSGDGRCVVSSNDLSWVAGDAHEALMLKARSRSLELVMPAETELSHELVLAGAEAHYYGDSSFKFKSRFTIVNASRADSWVALGMGTQRAHIIRVISSNDDPVFHLAKDLVALAERAALLVKTS